MYFLIFNSFHFFKKKSNIINYINKFIGQTLNKIKKIYLLWHKFLYINLQIPRKMNILLTKA